MSGKLTGKRKKTISENLAELGGYPVEGLISIPLLDCKWNREIQISGCMGILEYDEKSIVIKTKRGNCSITGEGLYMENFRSDTLTVHGVIDSIRFTERRKNNV